MARFVTAYDKRTGEALPNPVPKSWLDQGVFPHLSATPTRRATEPTPAPSQKKEG